VLRANDGQAAVELLAVVPALLVAGLVAWQLVLVGQAAWLSAHAARVAARADLVGEDPAAAARSALPEHLARGVEVRKGSERSALVRVPVPLVHPSWGGGVKIGASASLEAVR
jgi:hypothetical protein